MKFNIDLNALSGIDVPVFKVVTDNHTYLIGFDDCVVDVLKSDITLNKKLNHIKQLFNATYGMYQALGIVDDESVKQVEIVNLD